MPRNKYPEETVQKILDASLRLFQEKGYEQTTILDIVEQMGGLTRGAFYHHFKSKEEVLAAISERLYQDYDPIAIIQRETHLNGLEKLQLFFSNAVSGDAPKSDERDALNQIAVPLLKNPRFLSEHLRNTIAVSQDLTPLIEAGISDGSIAAGNAKLLAELLMLLLNVWSMPSLYPCEGDEAWEKIVLIKTLTDSLGMPILTDAVLQELARFGEEVLGYDEGGPTT